MKVVQALGCALLFLALTPFTADAAEGIDLEDCRISAGPGYPGIKARCGILLRPLNPDDDSSGTLDLHVAIVPALSLEPLPDPFVPIAGGPGQSTVEFYAAQAGAFERIRRKRDIVLLDQRGTGQSAALTCTTDDELVQGDYSREVTLAATQDCLDELEFDSRYFTTSVAVRDLEALRDALGYSQFNVYGVSYGSRVAQHFARRFPASTRTVILDGVVPPQLALGPDIAIEAQRALDAIFARCEENLACNDRYPSLRADFLDLHDRLTQDPVEVALNDPLTGKPETVTLSNMELAGAVRLLSYHPNSIALIPLLVQEAADGNLQPLAAQFSMSTEAMADALSIGMHNAVVCTEDVPFIDGLGDLGRTYIGPLMIDSLQTVCSLWPSGLIDDDFKEPLTTDLPVLLLSGDADPITPPAYAELAAVNLGNSLHLVGSDQGHGMAPRGCMPRIMADFVNDATVDALDTECLERLFAMPFFLDFSGPSP